MNTLAIIFLLIQQTTTLEGHLRDTEARNYEIVHPRVPDLFVDAVCMDQGAQWTITNSGAPMKKWGGYNVRRDRDGGVVHDCFNDKWNVCFRIPADYSFTVGPYLISGLGGESLTLYLTDQDGTRTGDSATITCGVLPAATPTPTPALTPTAIPPTPTPTPALTPTAIPPTPTPCPPFIDCQQPTPTQTATPTGVPPGPGL